MLLRPTISQSPPHPQPISLSSSHSLSNSSNFPFGYRISPLKNSQLNHPFVIKNHSSVSKVHSYGTVDYEKRPATTTVTWKAIYKRMSIMGNPEKGATEVLNQWENEGKRVTKWELCRIVKEMRKYGRHKLALEVFFLF